MCVCVCVCVCGDRERVCVLAIQSLLCRKPNITHNLANGTHFIAQKAFSLFVSLATQRGLTSPRTVFLFNLPTPLLQHGKGISTQAAQSRGCTGGGDGTTQRRVSASGSLVSARLTLPVVT